MVGLKWHKKGFESVGDLFVVQRFLGVGTAHGSARSVACAAEGVIHRPLCTHQHIAAGSHASSYQHRLPTLLIPALTPAERTDTS